MTIVLPPDTVIQISDEHGNACGYGLEVVPPLGKPAQYWFFLAKNPPAKAPGQDRMLPEQTYWKETQDPDWKTKTTAELFHAQARAKFKATETIYATATYGYKIAKQPDVGGFVITQNGYIVGAGEVTYSNNIYQEAWQLTSRFKPKEPYAFRHYFRFAGMAHPDEVDGVEKNLGPNPPGYLTFILFDVRYHAADVPPLPPI